MERLFSGSNGGYEVFRASVKEGLCYSEDNFKYIPIGWVKIKSGWYPLGYRIVTTNFKSLGLRHNPTILTYKIGQWVMEKNPVIPSKVDYGGIWSSRNLSSAKKTQWYCLEKKDPFETLIFYAAIYKPVFANNYRVKSHGVMLLEELKATPNR